MLTVPIAMFISQTSVTILYEPPSSYYNYVITYVIKYHKEGDPVWQTQSPVSCVTQTITGLMKATVYEFKVAAKYEGGRWGPDSGILRVKTGEFVLKAALI